MFNGLLLYGADGTNNVTLHNRLPRTQNRFDLNNLSMYKTSFYFKRQKMFILLHI